MSTITPWRAAAADIADQVATRPEAHINAIRHDAVRQALTCLVDAGDLWPRQDRIDHATDLLVDSVERQARLAGLGRVRLRGAA